MHKRGHVKVKISMMMEKEEKLESQQNQERQTRGDGNF